MFLAEAFNLLGLRDGFGERNQLGAFPDGVVRPQDRRLMVAVHPKLCVGRKSKKAS